MNTQHLINHPINHRMQTGDFRHQAYINPNLAPAVAYWAQEFRVPPSKLIQVVREVGRNIAEVRRRLAM